MLEAVRRGGSCSWCRAMSQGMMTGNESMAPPPPIPIAMHMVIAMMPSCCAAAIAHIGLAPRGGSFVPKGALSARRPSSSARADGGDVASPLSWPPPIGGARGRRLCSSSCPRLLLRRPTAAAAPGQPAPTFDPNSEQRILPYLVYCVCVRTASLAGVLPNY